MQSSTSSFAYGLALLICVLGCGEDAKGDARVVEDGSDVESPPPVPPPISMGCITETSAGHHVYACEGVNHDVEIPAQCLETQCGLVVDMHGGTMSADQEDENTTMRELGPQFGYVVLQPNAPGGLFYGEFDAPVLSMMELLTEAFHLDEKRWHMTGFSMGGYLTWRFVCNHGDVLASAAPMAAAPGNVGSPPSCGFSETEAAVEIPLLHLQGTMDPWTSNVSGEALRDAALAAWQMGPGEQVAGDETYRRTRYENANGTVYEFLQHDYRSEAFFANGPIGGHCFPGSTALAPRDPEAPNLGTPFGCEGETSFHWGSEVMKFFVAHPKR